MCCSGPLGLELPAPVAEMLAEYRRLTGEDWLWGEDASHSNAALLGQLRFATLEELIVPAVVRAQRRSPEASMQQLIEAALADDFDAMLRDALTGRVPTGLVALRLGPDGARVEHPGELPVLVGERLPFSLLVDSTLRRQALLGAPGLLRTVEPGGAALLELEWDAAEGCAVEVDGEAVDLGGAFRTAEKGRLRVTSSQPLRWSVTDGAGGGWFPEGVLRKWDFHRRPYFHGADEQLEVPAGPLLVHATGGIEFESVRSEVDVPPGGEAVIELDPPRWHDPASSGWYGGDLHVHMNYAGDQVCEPADAVRMQVGEGLHLMNLVAGNCTTSRVFDREALESWAGCDLPSPGDAAVARMGVEYRNDLLGHFHALNPSRPPSLYQTGHAASDHDEDWPPNAVAAAELREFGATIGYCHPVLLPMENDPGLVFDLMPRSVEAREVVVDAALGLVDSLDVLSNMSGPGSAVLYRRMLGAGVRLAVTAGTDCFLSFSRCLTFSNPPGWARCYARVEGPLTASSFQEAVRSGRTVATNGPWLELEVAGQGPGATVEAMPGSRIPVAARVTGPGVTELRIHSADGIVASVEVTGGGELQAELVAGDPTYLVAEAFGEGHPDVLDRHAYAHTSPVYVDVEGQRVAREADAERYLDWIDRLERLARSAGVFHDPSHLGDLVEVLERARLVYRSVVAGKHGRRSTGGGT